jgi:hypothetical protein
MHSFSIEKFVNYLIKITPFIFLITISVIININPWYISHTLFYDDSFYYLKIASNWAINNKMTFSGIGETNGFHPLWAYILGLSFKFYHFFGFYFDPIKTPLYITVFLSTINSYIFIFINEKLVQKICDNIIIQNILILLLYGFCWRFLYDGMESGIYLIILSLALYSIFTNSLLFFSLSISFIIWARVEGLLFMIMSLIVSIILNSNKYKQIFYSISNLYSFIRINYKSISISFFLIIISISLKFKYFNTQVSEKVKFYWFSLKNLQNVENSYSPIKYVFSTAKKMYFNYVACFDSVIAFIDPTMGYNSNPSGYYKNGDIYTKYFLVTISISFIIIFLKALHKKIYTNTKSNTNYFFNIFLTLFIFILIYSYITTYFSFSDRMLQWYFAAPTYLFIITFYFFLKWYNHMNNNIFKKLNFKYILSTLIIVFIYSFINLFNSILQPKLYEWRTIYNKIVLNVNTINLNQNETIGTWAAGHIGYFSNKQIVNLEGLIEREDVFKASINDDIRPVILSHNIKYIISKSLPKYITDNIKYANKGTFKWQMDIRARIYKDLNWKPIYIFNDSNYISTYTISKVTIKN